MFDTHIRYRGNWKVTDTAKQMKRLANVYRGDVLPYADMTFHDFYDLVKKIPYRRDPKGIEVLQRPRLTLASEGFGGDCDDKCITLMAYCYLRKIPFKILAVGFNAKKGLQHVMLRVYYAGSWHDADPTYPYGTFGRRVGEYGIERVIG